MRLGSAFAFLLILLAPPAGAAESAWVDLGLGSRVRLIADGALAADGTTRLGIEIELAAGTRTYWRVPGEAGLPMILELAGSTGIEGAEIRWPYPHREWQAGLLEHVYYGSVILPVEVIPAGGTSEIIVQADLTLGVCSDVCIPARAEFSLPVALGERDRSAAFRLDSAMADVPMSLEEGGTLFGAGQGSITVATDLPQDVVASMILATDDSAWVFGPPQIGRDSGLVDFQVLAGGDVSQLIGKTMHLVYGTEQGPFEVTGVVGPIESVDLAAKVE